MPIITHADLRSAWDALPQAERDYWHNVHLRYDSWCRPMVLALGGYFTTSSGFSLFRMNQIYQLIWTGSWNPRQPLIVAALWWTAPNPTWPRDPWGFSQEFDQTVEVPIFADPYPAAGRKVPKSYWTGVTRPRRNL